MGKSSDKAVFTVISGDFLSECVDEIQVKSYNDARVKRSKST